MGTEVNDQALRRSSAPGLSRDQVVGAALGMIDEQGTRNLTMRGLGKRIGVEAMSLYRYVSGREDLLEAIVDRLLQGIREQLDDAVPTSWQEYLQNLAHSVRDLALAHPRAFPLIATRHPAAPWLRPPLRSLEMVEDFLVTLGDFGFADEQKVEAYRAFTSFLLGHLLLDAAARGGETAPAEEPLDEGDAQISHANGNTLLARDSEVFRLRGLLSEDHGEEEFESALETLLDRIEMQISQ